MSLEKAIQENTEAVNRLAAGFVAFVEQVSRVASPAANATATAGGESVTMQVSGDAAPAAEKKTRKRRTKAEKKTRKRRTKAEIEADKKKALEGATVEGGDNDPEMKEKAKAKCAEVAEKLGKEKLAFLFSCFGAKKFSDVKPGAGVYADLIKRGDVMIAEGKPAADDADDLLGDEPTEEKPAATFEDVKAALEKLVAHPELGRTDVVAILTELGAARLGDLDKSKYGAAIEKAEATLKSMAAEGVG